MMEVLTALPIVLLLLGGTEDANAQFGVNPDYPVDYNPYDYNYDYNPYDYELYGNEVGNFPFQVRLAAHFTQLK